MNFDEIRQVWLRNGGSPAAVDVAASVAMAESGGDPNAHNDNAGTGDDSWGLWQINYFGALYWPRVAAFGMPNTLTDPDRAASAAITLSGNGINWRPWTTYTSGRYKQFMGSGSGTAPPAGSGTSSTSSPTPAAVSQPGHSGLTLWGMVTNQQQMAQALIRLGEILAGGMVLGFGVALVGYALAGRQVQGVTKKAVTRATPAGRALSLVKKTERSNRQQSADTRSAEIQAREDRVRRRVERDESSHTARRTTRTYEGARPSAKKSRPSSRPALTGYF